jgi:hypothetical protein
MMNFATDDTRMTTDRRAFDPLQVTHRDKWMLQHPILTRNYVIVTPPIEVAWQIIAETLATRRPGVTFGAHPRFGKTWTIRYLVPSVRAAFPKLVVHQFIAETHKPNSEAQFYATLGGVIEFRGLSNKQRYAIPGIVYNKLLISALESESKTLVLFGDEMQRFTQDDWTWLIDLSNKLERDGVRMICISFGQPELASFRNIQRSIGRVDILGRFMTRFYAFDGVSSASSMSKVLTCYDDPGCVEFPPGSGCSFTEFFYPYEYSQGARLANFAEPVWREFDLVGRETVSFKGTLSIGMEWVSLVAEQLLLKGSVRIC